MERAEAEQHLQHWIRHGDRAQVHESHQMLCTTLTDLCATGLSAAVTLDSDNTKRHLVLAGGESAVIWRILEAEHVEARLWTPRTTSVDITVDCKAEAGAPQTLRETRDWTFHDANGDTITLRMVTTSLATLAGPPAQRRPDDPETHNAIWRMAKAAGWPVPTMPSPAAT